LDEPILRLKPGREKSVAQRHPWIFGGAVAGVWGDPGRGDTVIVHSAEGEFLARAAYNTQSQIVGRIWSWDVDEPVDGAFFERHIHRSIRARDALAQSTDALRWVNAESDGIPGLVVDRYGPFAVCQFLTAGAGRWKQEIAQVVAGQPGIAGVYERSDVDVRAKEGLKATTGVLCGEAPPETVEVHEGEWRFAVDIVNGHKTGFYLDQRENRKAVAALAAGRDVLNAFAYTGAFAVAALSHGARSVVSIDSAKAALTLAETNLQLNDLTTEGVREGDVFHILREYRDSGRTFDMVILDPPKFAQSQAKLNKASRAYKDINWLAFRILRPGGYLVTFSCSGLMSAELFQKVVFGAALDAGRQAQIVGRLSQASDHPVRLTFPEGWYLKGFVCKVEEA
jgi:23S rRNA (cytosine1962-C5)-methyltransferase